MEDNKKELAHHGIKGQKWGKRRFQREDGSLTNAGRIRYRGEIDDSRSGNSPKTESNDSLKNTQNTGHNRRVEKRKQDVSDERANNMSTKKGNELSNDKHSKNDSSDNIRKHKKTNSLGSGKSDKGKSEEGWELDKKDREDSNNVNKGKQTVTDLLKQQSKFEHDPGKNGYTKDGTKWEEHSKYERGNNEGNKETVNTAGKFGNGKYDTGKDGSEKNGSYFMTVNEKKPETKPQEIKKQETKKQESVKQDLNNQKTHKESGKDKPDLTDSQNKPKNPNQNKNDNNQPLKTSGKLGKTADAVKGTGQLMDEANKINKFLAGKKNKKQTREELDALDDTELRKKLERMRMEDEYSSRTSSRMSKGHQFISDVFTVGSSVAAVTVSALTIAKLIKELQGN